MLPTAEDVDDHSGSYRHPSTYLTGKAVCTSSHSLQQWDTGGILPPPHIMATAPNMGSLPPSDLLLPPGQHFSGMISVHYSLWTPMGPHTESAVKCASPLGQRTDLVCPAEPNCCQAAAADTSTRFVLQIHHLTLFMQPAKKTSAMGFIKHLMVA